VIFVFPDEPMALPVAQLADALMRGRIASLEGRQTTGLTRGVSFTREAEWPCSAR
jgi:hypothetical protein